MLTERPERVASIEKSLGASLAAAGGLERGLLPPLLEL